MMKLLRKHRQWLMIVIAILAIPFVFYFVQKPDYGAIRSDQFGRVYDRNVSMMEAQQTVRLFNLAQALGMSDFVQSLTVGAGQNQNQAYTEFILNLLVLRSRFTCISWRRRVRHQEIHRFCAKWPFAKWSW